MYTQPFCGRRHTPACRPRSRPWFRTRAATSSRFSWRPSSLPRPFLAGAAFLGAASFVAAGFFAAAFLDAFFFGLGAAFFAATRLARVAGQLAVDQIVDLRRPAWPGRALRPPQARTRPSLRAPTARWPPAAKGTRPEARPPCGSRSSSRRWRSRRPSPPQPGRSTSADAVWCESSGTTCAPSPALSV